MILLTNDRAFIHGFDEQKNVVLWKRSEGVLGAWGLKLSLRKGDQWAFIHGGVAGMACIPLTGNLVLRRAYMERAGVFKRGILILHFPT